MSYVEQRWKHWKARRSAERRKLAGDGGRKPLAFLSGAQFEERIVEQKLEMNKAPQAVALTLSVSA